MNDESGYNGWKNYETWVMALWIDNDEWSYNYSRELVVGQVNEALENEDEHPETVRSAVATELQTWMEELMYGWEPESASVFTDLLHAAFSEVDWYEIAENYLAELNV
jgi:hypothetical protein